MFFGKKHPKPKTIQSFKIDEISTILKDCMIFGFGFGCSDTLINSSRGSVFFKKGVLTTFWLCDNFFCFQSNLDQT